MISQQSDSARPRGFGGIFTGWNEGHIYDHGTTPVAVLLTRRRTTELILRSSNMNKRCLVCGASAAPSFRSHRLPSLMLVHTPCLR